MNIKRHFKSRYGPDGWLIEVDWGQLEVVMEAYLCQDANMIRDIKAGVDFHCKRVALELDMPYKEVVDKYKAGDEYITKVRKDIKSNITFKKQYGATPESIAKSSGLSLKKVEDFLAKEDEAYPNINIFHKNKLREVYANRTPGWGHTKNGNPRGMGWYTCLTKQRWAFLEEDRGRDVWFKTTKVRNYITQGSSAMWVKLAMTNLWRRFYQDPEFVAGAKIVNTIHDAYLFDVANDHMLELVCRHIYTTLIHTPDLWEKAFGVKFNVPIGIDIEYGKNWGDMNHVWKKA